MSTSQGVLIVGASSAIAEQTARLYARDGARLFLVGRDAGKLDAMAADLGIRGATSVRIRTLDVLAYERHRELIDEAAAALSGIDISLIAHGMLPDQRACERDFGPVLEAMEVNALATMSLLTHLAIHLERRRAGTLAVISSVAGERGRQSNYVYGTAKGSLTVFLEGLRNRLHGAGVHVLAVKPGLVDTPMTAHLQRNPLWATPEQVARDIHRAIRRGRNVVYTPAYWGWVMAIIRALPPGVIKRLRL